MMDKLTDEQNGLLNQISYLDITKSVYKPGMNLYDFVEKSGDTKLAEKVKAQGLDHFVIKDYQNNNKSTGFCALAFMNPDTFETGMMFRGTEEMPNPLTKDMGDNILTMGVGHSPQAQQAIQFYEKNKDPYGHNFIYGHSKGGELGTQVYVHDYENIKGVHIINAQPINPYWLTPEQLEALNKKKFDAVIVSGDIVSSLGNRPYPVRYLKDNGKKDGAFGPHSIENIDYDEDGNAIIEPKPFSDHLVLGFSAFALQRLLNRFQFFNAFAIQVVLEVTDFLMNDIPNAIREFVENVQKTFNSIKDLAVEIRNDLRDFVDTLVNNVSLWFKKTFNPGYQYASSHPHIKVDTYKLRNYAEQLESINRRLSQLDHSMDSLYTKVGFLDLWNLIQADLLTGESWKIRKVVSYLEETADDFDDVETRIMSSL